MWPPVTAPHYVWQSAADAMEDVEVDSKDRAQHAHLVASVVAFEEGLGELLVGDHLSRALFRVEHTAELARFLVGLSRSLPSELAEELVLSLMRVAIDSISAGHASAAVISYIYPTIDACKISLKSSIYATPVKALFGALDDRHTAFLLDGNS
ncbi:hypothetical protein T492DRAFT_1098652, partial [Pavlovales sp. CCMP2436]